MSDQKTPKTGRARGRGAKVGPQEEEQIVAYYLTCQNYTQTAEKTGRPIVTVWDVVKRRLGDSLQEMRERYRADFIHQAMATAAKCLPTIEEGAFGSKGAGKSLEAARAFESIVRGVSSMEPKEKPKEPDANLVGNILVDLALENTTTTPLPTDGETTTTLKNN